MPWQRKLTSTVLTQTRQGLGQHVSPRSASILRLDDEIANRTAIYTQDLLKAKMNKA